MKKMLTLMLSMALLSGMAATAETDETKLLEPLPAETEIQMDLNGDGTDETLTWRSVAENEFGDEHVELTAGESVWTSDRLCGAEVRAVDADQDGVVELFVSGDEMSDDYLTYCLHFDGVQWTLIPFANASRGETADEFTQTGYGRVTALEENRVTLCGSQDMLGTYMMERSFALKDGRFEFADDGLYVSTQDPSDADLWEYRSLTLKQDTEATFVADDGEQTGTLNAGERVMVVSGDKESIVNFVTEDGRSGFFTVAPDETQGWGSLIGGVSENEVFESIPYAD